MEQDGSSKPGETQASAGQPADTPGAWVFTGILAAMAVYALYTSFDFAIEIRRWPLGLSVFILLCVAIYAVQQALRARAAARTFPGEQETDIPTEYSPRGTAITLLATAAFVLFLVGAYLVSFLLATAIFLPAYMLAAGERRPGVLAGVTVGMLLAVWFLFGSLLHAPVEIGALVSLDWHFD